MDIVQAIRERRSCRLFKHDPVPKKTLAEIVEIALRAPSWQNVQPWEVIVAGGKELEVIKEAFLEASVNGDDLDFPAPIRYPEPYDTRRRTLGYKVFEIEGIRRDDRPKRHWWRTQGLGLFGAPNVIYIYTDKSFCWQDDKLIIWPIFDCGIFAQTIMLLATSRGLATIPQRAAVDYPDILRKTFGLPDNKLFLIGISIGYPVPDAPINQLYTEREPLDKLVRWQGFD